MDAVGAIQAKIILRSGLGTLAVAMFGMGWLGSGLGMAHAFTPAVIVLFDVFGVLLLGFSIYFIRKGRSLRKTYPASEQPQTKPVRKQFMVVVVLEVTLIIVVTTIAHLLDRPDMAPLLAAIVVGLHFLPLGKIFGQPQYYLWGTAITLWCAVCVILFRSTTLVASSNIGTGILLWATCAHGLLRTGKIARTLGR